MSQKVARAAAIGLALAFVAACHEDAADLDPSRSLAAGGARASQANADPSTPTNNQPPSIASLALHPAYPVSEGMIEARVDASDPDGGLVQLVLTWKLNGRVLEEGARTAIRLPELKRGDRLELTVRPNDGVLEGEPRSVSARYENRAPTLTFVYVTPQNKRIRRGDVLTAVPEASDPDNDRLTYAYRWRVNGIDTSKERQFDTKGLRRGDKVTVQVTASDGALESSPSEIEPIVLENSAPVIKRLPALEHQGATLTYQFEAEDPEGDRNLRYFLSDAPDGMEIDSLTGLLTWSPSPEQAGKHLVKVGVRDSEGEASQFEWEVSVNAGAPPAARSE